MLHNTTRQYARCYRYAPSTFRCICFSYAAICSMVPEYCKIKSDRDRTYRHHHTWWLTSAHMDPLDDLHDRLKDLFYATLPTSVSFLTLMGPGTCPRSSLTRPHGKHSVPRNGRPPPPSPPNTTSTHPLPPPFPRIPSHPTPVCQPSGNLYGKEIVHDNLVYHPTMLRHQAILHSTYN
jgi:hypothetical protein